ncbi:MAG: ribonuclease J [Erysipelotrichia bacterium]|nr:ribonuclease J [Erysipelotrichia bacterium]
MEDVIKVAALGGLDENGRDCYVIEINDDIFVLDCGLALPDKTIPGVDYLLANAQYLITNKERIRAYVMTHAHDENMGALKYFYDYAPAPIYCTSFTKRVIETQFNFNKLRISLDFHVVLPTSSVDIAGRKLHFFQTAHNAAYSFGVAIETSKGNLVYTSDFIVDYSVKSEAYIFNIKALSALSEKPTFLLMSDSKAAHLEGYCAPHHRITPLIEKYFKSGGKRIFINCFWQNFYRLTEIIDLCVENNKRLFFYNDFTRRIMEMLADFKPTRVPPAMIVKNADLLRVREQDLVILMLGEGGEIYEELIKIVDGTNEDKRMRLNKRDIFISAAIATPTLETIATRSNDYLYRTGAEVVLISNKVLSSMHPRHDDLKFFLSVLKPKYYFPVRGNYINLMANAKLALSMGIGLNHTNVFILDNGMQLTFNKEGRPSILPNNPNEMPTHPILVDGRGLSTNVSENIVNDRRQLSVDGVVVVALSISLKEKRIVAGPDCQMRGFVYVKEAEPLLKSIANIFVDEVTTALSLNNTNFEEIKANARERMRRFIRRENGREPMIIPVLLNRTWKIVEKVN